MKQYFWIPSVLQEGAQQNKTKQNEQFYVKIVETDKLNQQVIFKSISGWTTKPET